MTIGTTPNLSRTHERRVVIVGGGLAGISAVETLAHINASLPENARFQITLLEARRVTGGRAGSFVDSLTREPVDYCQHVAMGCCTNLLAMLNRSGLIDRWQPYRELTFYHPQHGFSLFRPSRWMPAPLHLDAAINGLRFLSRIEKRQIKRALWRLMRTPESDLNHQTAAEWLRQQGQDDVVRERFWDVILVSALGDRPERVSMDAARKVLIDGFAATRGASDVWVPREPLSNVFGSCMIEWLKGLGVDLHVGRIVQSLVPTAEDQLGVSLELSDSESMQADQVVLAVPLRATKRLLSTLGESAFDQDSWEGSETEMKHSPITGLHLWFDRPLTTHDQVVMVGTISPVDIS